MTGPGPLALVTGASSGVGLELARQFAGAGSDPVVTEDTEPAPAADELPAAGPTVQAGSRTIAGVAAVHASRPGDRPPAGRRRAPRGWGPVTWVQGRANSLPDRLGAAAHGATAEPGPGT